MPQMKKYSKAAVAVVSNVRVAPEHYCLTFADVEMANEALPGQFFQVRAVDNGGPFVPRPFSIYDWHFGAKGEKAGVKLLYKVVGPGTKTLSRLEAGGKISVTGPLGNAFTLPERGKTAFILAGGVGIAPFVALVRHAISMGTPAEQFHLLYGARCNDQLVEQEQFQKLGVPHHVITDDGSCGLKGNAIDLLLQHTEDLKPDDYFIYASGPLPMLKALTAHCRRKGIRGEVTLEERMVCGFGVCNSCAVAVRSGKAAEGWTYKLVCRDGPVFSVQALYA